MKCRPPLLQEPVERTLSKRDRLEPSSSPPLWVRVAASGRFKVSPLSGGYNVPKAAGAWLDANGVDG